MPTQKKVSRLKQFMLDSEAPYKVYSNIVNHAADSVLPQAVKNISYKAACWTIGPVLHVAEPPAAAVWHWLEEAAKDPVVVKATE
jgi:hypothetical protein